jgi:glycosyltransferase involved in cell wall biosynthesis
MREDSEVSTVMQKDPMGESTKYLSIVVPVYNEGSVIESLHLRLKRVLDSLNIDYEIVFVDDGSTDNTLDLLKGVWRSDRKVKIIELRGNFGQTAALAAGFDYAQGEILIAMDGDLQHFPEDIPKFLEKMQEGYDIVSGWRERRVDSFFGRRLPSMIANWLMARISGLDLHDFGTTFKAYRREIIKEVRLYGEFHRFIPVIARNHMAKMAEIPIQNVHSHRKSHYSIGRTITVFFDLIRLNFLNKYLSRPLQIFGTLGFCLVMIGIAIEVYLTYLKYVYGLGLLEYRGPLFILGLLFIVLGTLFVVLGLLGEMIVKLFHDLHEIKIYSVAKVYENSNQE